MMGAAKEWMLAQMERGYDEVGGDICAECVSDPALVKWIDDHRIANECSFCGRKAKRPIAASFDDFLAIIVDGIHFDWNHPDDEGIMYVGADGGYQAEISDNSEVLYDCDVSERQNVVDAMVAAIHDNGWVERDYYRGDDSQRMATAWDWFKYFTKHQSRYLFLKSDDQDLDDIPPSEMLDRIAAVISKDLAISR